MSLQSRNDYHHSIFLAERLDLAACLSSLKDLLKDHISIESTHSALCIKTDLTKEIGFLNRSIVDSDDPDLHRVIADCRAFDADNRIDIFYENEPARLKHSHSINPKIQDIYMADSKTVFPKLKADSKFSVDNDSDPELYTDAILGLNDRESSTHQIFLAMSKRPSFQRFTVKHENKIVAAASYTIVGDFLKLSGVNVDESYRNRGLQKALISLRISHALKIHEFNAVYSITKRSSISSQNLRKMGFELASVIETMTV